MYPTTELNLPSQELSEAIKAANTTTELYRNIVKTQKVQNPRWAIVGPGIWPNDVTSLAISHALGSEGLLYSVDPQGQEDQRVSEFVRPETYSVGGSAFLEEQFSEFRKHGISLSKFEWLGPKSHFGFIPPKASEIDGLADHSGIEFLESAVNEKQYLIDGVGTQIRAIKQKGIYVYQSEDPNKLRQIFGMPYEQWLSSQGLEVTTHTLKNDSVQIKVNKETITWLNEHKDEMNGYGKKPEQLWRFLKGNKLVFVPNDDAIWYPSKHVFVGQKK